MNEECVDLGNAHYYPLTSCKHIEEWALVHTIDNQEQHNVSDTCGAAHNLTCGREAGKNICVKPYIVHKGCVDLGQAPCSTLTHYRPTTDEVWFHNRESEQT